MDPKVDSEAIAVSADVGTVTLRGTVGSPREKRETGKSACRVYRGHRGRQRTGRTATRRQQPRRRRTARQRAAGTDAGQPDPDDRRRQGAERLRHPDRYGSLAAPARRGRVPHRQHPGVSAIQNDIRLTSTQNARDVKKDISDAFLRNAKLDADRLFIDTTSYRRVTLAGTVSSWAEHDEAVDAAWSAPGVTEVDDLIQVAY